MVYETEGEKRIKGKISEGFSIFLTFLFISFTWIFFRASSFGNALDILRQMVPGTKGINQYFSWSFVAIILLCVATCYAVFKSKREREEKKINGYYLILDLNCFWNLVFFFCMIGLILGLMYVEGNPFIYAQF